MLIAKHSRAAQIALHIAIRINDIPLLVSPIMEKLQIEAFVGSQFNWKEFSMTKVICPKNVALYTEKDFLECPQHQQNWLHITKFKAKHTISDDRPMLICKSNPCASMQLQSLLRAQRHNNSLLTFGQNLWSQNPIKERIQCSTL